MAHNGNGADEELRWPSSENNSDPRWTETNSVYSLSSMQVPDRSGQIEKYKIKEASLT